MNKGNLKLPEGSNTSSEQTADRDRDAAPASLVVHRQSNAKTTCLDVLLWDVCDNGFKILSEIPFLFEERVTVDFSATKLKAAPTLGARVVCIRPHEHAWIIVLAFETDRQDGFTDRLSSFCQANRRKVQRSDIEVLAEAKKPGQPISLPITLLDCSAYGLRFATSSSIEIGEPIMLVLNGGDDRNSRILATAKWIRQDKQGQLVGCEVSGISRNDFNCHLAKLTGNYTIIPKIRLWQRLLAPTAALGTALLLGWLTTLKR